MKTHEAFEATAEETGLEHRSDDEEEISSLGAYLRASREKLGMSIREAAEEAGISSVYLGKLESGQAKNPSLAVAYELAQTYRVTLDDLAEYLVDDVDREINQEIRHLKPQVDYLRWEGRDWTTLDRKAKRIYLQLLKSMASGSPGATQ